MGSWLWVKKNPRQMLSLLGFFNPLIAHRHARVLRRHIHWLEFIGRAACGHRGWVPTAPNGPATGSWPCAAGTTWEA
jgi:hypothetical protein